MRIAVNITYNGEKYCGWQVQKNALSIQERLQNALEDFLGFRPDISGCSRTDAGVHANNYVFHLDADGIQMPCEKFTLALNANLHDSGIAAKSAFLVDDEFHARYSCLKKEYVYKIWNAKYMNPFLEGQALHFPYELDEQKLLFVGEEFKGKHDFAAFMSKGSKIKEETVRTVEYFRAERTGNLVELHVCADGFLYNMVRIMAGTYIAANAGRIKEGDISEILLSKNRKLAGDTAPAHALYLNKIFYPEQYGIKSTN